MKRYKVTGKFCILGESDNVLKGEIFVNKIINADNHRKAMESAVGLMREKFSLKYKEEVNLRQLSNVVVKKF
jgi:hypothetical protein